MFLRYGALLLVLIAVSVFSWQIVYRSTKSLPKIHQPEYGSQDYSAFDGTHFSIQLVDPETAPANIKPLVLEGYHLVMETQKHAKEYAGDSLNCRNCHFAGGNTLGGKNNGISLVGVTEVYPRTLPNGNKLSLEERINYCFEKSMNGKPLPIDSLMMKSMVAYSNWISQGIPRNASFEWLGLKKIKSSHKPNAEQGVLVYHSYCSQCHGDEGQGKVMGEGLTVPPLWGEHAFNSAAGMNSLPTFSSFVYENMPYDELGLSIEQALDVAAYVTSQPRPQRQ